MKIGLQFLAVAAFVFVADFIWLGIVMRDFYKQEMGQLMRLDEQQNFRPRLLPAALVYVLIPAGILLFVGPKAGGSLLNSLVWGALFGLVVYGIYDLSNLAVMEKWNWRITIADILWGTTLCALSAACLHLTTKVLK